jgi:serine protease Do
MRVGEQLKKTGKVVRGRIGVQIGEVSKDVAQSLGLPNAKGAQVSMVEEGGPADKAGIKPGDIILKFNGAQIERSSDLPRLVGGAAVNGKSTVTVWRKGAQQDIAVTVVELEAEKTAKKGAREPEAQAVNALGLKVSDVPAAKKQELKIDAGVLVDDAVGVAALAGLQPGDVILQLNNVAVKDAKQFNALVAKLDPKKSSAVLVRRGDVALFVSLRPSAK